MKNITLCADDYGQNTAISQAIIVLLKEKKLSAVSCMTTMPHWLAHATWLAPFKDQADRGVHFNLTHGKPLSPAWVTAEGDAFPSLFTLLRKSYLRQLNKTAVLAELHAQLDQFITGTGRMPDFIDGHQHVHQFPVIRDVLLTLYQERLREHRCYIRCVNDSNAWLRIHHNAYIKRCIIQLCGAGTFKQMLIRNKIPHNPSFSGTYHFPDAMNYAKLFSGFLQQSLDGGLIMCHPGLEGAETADEISQSRPKEYHYFQSEQFVKACQQNHAVITRFMTDRTILFK